VRAGRHIIAIVVLGLGSSQSLGLTFSFTYIDDASGTFASRGWLNSNSLFQQNIRAAANLWAARINSNQTIVVRVDTHSYSARAGGTNSSGRFLYTNSAGKKVWEPGPLTRVLTGSNPGQTAYGYDILLGFDASFVENYYWFDPQPALRTATVPSNRGDFVSVVMHELGHGFGMTGYRDFPTGQILGPDAMLFDDKSYFGGNGNPIAFDGSRNPMFFRGNNAAALYGGDLHLTNQNPGDFNYSQNYFHLSACGGTSDGLEGTLMNGCVLPEGSRLDITPFDIAVFKDLGYPLVTQTADFNRNGKVDAADYTLWRKTFGQTGIGLAADANLNNKIDVDDYAYWRSHFGLTSGSGAANESFGFLAVPEPSTSWLFAALVVGLVGGLRRSPRPLFG